MIHNYDVINFKTNEGTQKSFARTHFDQGDKFAVLLVNLDF